MEQSFIKPHGGYQNLVSYKKAEIVYDATVYFCVRFIKKNDRTYDQMVQAARSGNQNIIEGSQASGMSKEMELKLTNVARASLEELLADYCNYLRVRDIEEWTREHKYTKRLRMLNKQPDANYETFRKGIEHSDPAIAANVIIGLIKLTNYLLDRQIAHLEKEYLEDGGLRENMKKARREYRSDKNKKLYKK